MRIRQLKTVVTFVLEFFQKQINNTIKMSEYHKNINRVEATIYHNGKSREVVFIKNDNEKNDWKEYEKQ